MFAYITDKRGRALKVDLSKYSPADDSWFLENAPAELPKIKRQAAAVKPIDVVGIYRQAKEKAKTIELQQPELEQPEEEKKPDIRETEAPFLSWTGLKERATELVSPKGEGGIVKRQFMSGPKKVAAFLYALADTVSKFGDVFHADTPFSDDAKIYLEKRIQDMGGRDIHTGIAALVPDFLAIENILGSITKVMPFLKAATRVKVAMKLNSLAKANAPIRDVVRAIAPDIMKEIGKGAVRGAAAGAIFEAGKTGTAEGALKGAETWAGFEAGLGGLGRAVSVVKLPGFKVWREGIRNPDVKRLIGELEQFPKMADDHIIGTIALDMAEARKMKIPVRQQLAKRSYIIDESLKMMGEITPKSHRLMPRARFYARPRPPEFMKELPAGEITPESRRLPAYIPPARFIEREGKLTDLANKLKYEKPGMTPIETPTYGVKQPRLYKPGRAYTEFMEDGATVVRAIKEANVADFAHELAHIWRRDLPVGTLKILEKVMGIGAEGWTVKAEEQFANMFESYLASGKGATGAQSYLFNQYKQWLGDIYRGVKNSPLSEQVSPELDRIFGAITGGGKPLPEMLVRAWGKSNEQKMEEARFRREELKAQTLGTTEEIKQSADWLRKRAKEIGLGPAFREFRMEPPTPWAQKAVNVWKKIGSETFSQIEMLRDIDESLYVQAKKLLGASGKAKNMILKNLEFAFKPIKNRKELIDGQTLPEFVSNVAASIRAKHIVEVRGKEVSPEMLASYPKYLERFARLQSENPELFNIVNQAVNNLDTISNKILEYYLKNDLISKQVYLRIKEENPFHVPFHRILEASKADQSGPATATSIKRFLGSKKPVRDVIENIVTNYLTMIPVADRMVLNRNVVNKLARDPRFAKMITIEEAVHLPVNLRVSMKEAGIESLFEPGELQTAIEYISPRIKLDPNQILYNEGGIFKIATFKEGAERFIGALKRPDIEIKGKELIRKMGLNFIKRLKHTGVVMTPGFAARNAIKDFAISLIHDPTLSHGIMFWPEVITKAIPEYGKAVWEVAFKRGDFMEKLQKYGAGGEFFARNTDDAVALIENAIADRSKAQVFIDMIRHPGKIIGALEDINKVIEQLPRYRAGKSVYEDAIKRGLSHDAAMNEAVMTYRNITADFLERGGWAVNIYGESTPFFTAQLAGLKAELNYFKKNPAEYLSKTFQLITLPTIAYWFAVKDQDWYKKIPLVDKIMYWHSPWGVKIPKPFGFAGMIGGSMIENHLNAINKTNPEEIEGLWHAFRTAVPSIPLPPLASALIGKFAGKHPYFGTPIEGGAYIEHTPKWRRAKLTTTEMAKIIPGILMNQGGLSPAEIDYLVNEFTGSLGSIAMETGDRLLHAVRRLQGDKVIQAQIKSGRLMPLIQRNAVFNPYSEPMRLFYKYYNDAAQAQKNITDMEKGEGPFSERQKRNIEANRWKYDAMRNYFSSTSREIAGLRKEYKRIASPYYTEGISSSKEKQEMLDAIVVKMNSLATEAVDKYVEERGREE